jgi:hypothetical protein
MFARSVKLLALIFLFPLPAEAKTINFLTGSPFGLGILGGVSQNPSSDLVEKPYTEKSDYSYFAGIDPFLDFGNFVIKGHIQYHNLSILTGPTGSLLYSDTSDAGLFLYGGSLLLVPFLSADGKFRFYFRGGANLASVEGENARTYSTGAKYLQKFSGSGLEKQGALGLEILMVQNYSVALEFGYRELTFDTLQLDSGTGLDGSTLLAGSDLLTTNGTKKSMKYNGLFASLALNLNF